MWKAGTLTNNKNISQQSKKRIFKAETLQETKTFLKLQDKPSLLVVLDGTMFHDIIEEGHASRIPIITFRSTLNDNKSLYKIPDYLIDKDQEFIFFEILNSILKIKPKIIKKKSRIVQFWFEEHNKAKKYYKRKQQEKRNENTQKNNNKA